MDCIAHGVAESDRTERLSLSHQVPHIKFSASSVMRSSFMKVGSFLFFFERKQSNSYSKYNV